MNNIDDLPPEVAACDEASVIDGPAGADWREPRVGLSPGDDFPESIPSQMPAETVEQEIQRKGLTAPRVTPADIEANIASEHYFTAAEGVIGSNGCEQGLVSGPLNLLTICVLVLRNGYTVHGVSACASPENFNAALGKRIARENAVREMWPLMGYALRERLHDAAALARGGIKS